MSDTIKQLRGQLIQNSASIDLLQGQVRNRKAQLTACRAELEVTRAELASALGEGDALKAERDAALKTKVLGEEQRKLWRCTERQLERVTAERDKLRALLETLRDRDKFCGCSDDPQEEMCDRCVIQAALEPATKSDGAVKEDKCPRADTETKSCARDS